MRNITLGPDGKPIAVVARAVVGRVTSGQKFTPVVLGELPEKKEEPIKRE